MLLLMVQVESEWVEGRSQYATKYEEEEEGRGGKEEEEQGFFFFF